MIKSFTFCVAFFLVAFLSIGQTTIGPENGTIMAIGGGFTTLEMVTLLGDYMGGKDQPLVVVPTALEPSTINVVAEKQTWVNRGFTDVTVLHTIDTAVANTDSFVAPIKAAAGVWFGGGRQWRLVDAYMGTKTLDEFHKVLERGGIIAGSSAGASIQGSFLARGAEASNIPIIAPEPEHQVGFGFLKNSAIDQHIDTRDRWDEMEEIIIAHPEIFGVGLSESTAIVVQGNCFEVIGVAQVAITDSTRLNNCVGDACYEVLVANDSFNLVPRLKGGCSAPPTGIKSIENKVELTLFPNPNTGIFTIDAGTQPIQSVTVFNLLGAVVHTETSAANSGSIQISMPDIEPGIYLTAIRTNQGLATRHLIIGQ